MFDLVTLNKLLLLMLFISYSCMGLMEIGYAFNYYSLRWAAVFAHGWFTWNFEAYA